MMNHICETVLLQFFIKGLAVCGIASGCVAMQHPLWISKFHVINVVNAVSLDATN